MKLSNLMGVDTYKEAIKEVQLSNDALQERLFKANKRLLFFIEFLGGGRNDEMR